MGVKHFYIWLKKNYNDCIHIVDKNYHNKNITNNLYRYERSYSRMCSKSLRIW